MCLVRFVVIGIVLLALAPTISSAQAPEHGVRELLQSGSFVIPTGVTAISVELWGAGVGGGGGAGAVSSLLGSGGAGGGGGSGAYLRMKGTTCDKPHRVRMAASPLFNLVRALPFGSQEAAAGTRRGFDTPTVPAVEPVVRYLGNNRHRC
jgi:hypothetical protein